MPEREPPTPAEGPQAGTRETRVNPPIVRARMPQDRRTAPKVGTLEKYESYITCEKFDTHSHMEPAMLVWVWPEKKHETFGARRWVVEWYELKPGADIDEDRDPMEQFNIRLRAFPVPALAWQFARTIVDEGRSAFGTAEVQEEAVDWYVEEDRIAEWVRVGRPEIIE